MFPVFALIFLIVPLVEFYILIQVGQVIGALWTVFFVVLTAIIGVQLLKSQGLSTLSRAQQKMHQGELPAEELLEGMALLLAGAFLLPSVAAAVIGGGVSAWVFVLRDLGEDRVDAGGDP